MSRQKQTARPLSVSPSPPLPLPLSLSRHGMLAWFAALLVARWLIPTEGAVEGLTLWLVQLVLLTAVARAVWAWRFDERPFRFDAMDGAIALLIVAQVVSALAVVLGVGNSRAAINLAWEWVGSGVLIWLLRQELRATRAVLPLCLGLSLTAGVLAGYGLWQHYVWYDEMSREYDRLTIEHDRLSQSPTDARRLQSLRAEMSRQGIPVEPAARQSLEQRLKASREPFGLFALANTFAGLLAVMLLIVAGTIPAGTKPWDWIAAALLALVIGYCLVLTKSRTAWVGLLAGIGWWLFRVVAARWRRGDSPTQQRSVFVRWIVGGAVVLGIAVTIAVVSGGLDKAVLSEAPKSVRYRLEYWQGTWATIREHIWLGTGPGNFRDDYLAHKLPESSEEIADPHNLIFDVWANAGTFGLIGLLACLGLMTREFVQPRDGVGSLFQSGGSSHEQARVIDRRSEKDSRPLLSAGMWGVGLAFPLSAVGLELMGHGTDERLWWLGGIWWGMWLIGVLVAQRASAERSSESDCVQTVAVRWSLEAAGVALLVHLLGAGGIAMPAITQLLWLVWSLRVACAESSATAREEKSPSESASGGVKAARLPVGAFALAAGGLFVLCWWTATMPEILCRTSLQIGDAEWGRGQFAAASKRYFEASRADPSAIEPLERLAEATFQRWQATHTEHDFEESVQRRQAVITRLPFASRPFRRLGQVWMARFEHSREMPDATRAVEAYSAAVERYPHHAELLSESATACEQAGLIEQAQETARRAVRQDDLNRLAGHSDKFLDGQTRRRMERLAAEPSEPN